MVALPTVLLSVWPGAAPRAYSWFAHVRPCAQGRCGRCPLGLGVMSNFCLFVFDFVALAVWWLHGWSVGGFVCAIVVVVLGDARPLLLSQHSAR